MSMPNKYYFYDGVHNLSRVMKPKEDNSKNEKDSFFVDSLKMIFLPAHITWSHYIIKNAPSTPVSPVH